MADLDRSFDEVAHRFTQGIYGKAKGQLRLRLLWRDMLEQGLVKKKQPVLDVGGGGGQMSALLALAGCQVTMVEPNGSLAREAQSHFQELGVDVSVHVMSLAEYLETNQKVWPLVVCHAVLEWVDDTTGFLNGLRSLVCPDEGVLSLAFYNLNGIVMRNLVRGNLFKVASGRFSGDRGSLTPTNPVDPDQVVQILIQGDRPLFHQSRRGIRVFFDYMSTAHQKSLPIEDVEALEWQYGAQESWKGLGRYIHDVWSFLPHTSP